MVIMLSVSVIGIVVPPNGVKSTVLDTVDEAVSETIPVTVKVMDDPAATVMLSPVIAPVPEAMDAVSPEARVPTDHDGVPVKKLR
jgi:hypothetical protein